VPVAWLVTIPLPSADEVTDMDVPLSWFTNRTTRPSRGVTGAARCRVVRPVDAVGLGWPVVVGRTAGGAAWRLAVVAARDGGSSTAGLPTEGRTAGIDGTSGNESSMNHVVAGAAPGVTPGGSDESVGATMARTTATTSTASTLIRASALIALGRPARRWPDIGPLRGRAAIVSGSSAPVASAKRCQLADRSQSVRSAMSALTGLSGVGDGSRYRGNG
jgi:hypothetical protein